MVKRDWIECLFFLWCENFGIYIVWFCSNLSFWWVLKLSDFRVFFDMICGVGVNV